MTRLRRHLHLFALTLVLFACGSSTVILQSPADVATTKTLKVGESVCWVEPKWMYPGPTDCHGYWDPAPGVPKCTSTKSPDDPSPRRTVWTTGYEIDSALTAETRKKSEPLACCYRCIDKLYDLGE